MFFEGSTAAIEYKFQENLYKYSNPEYAYIRCVDMDEYNMCNATFWDDGRYYQAIKINNISEKEAIMEFSKKEKFFDEKQNEILSAIMDSHSVEIKNNFFDYYD